MPKLLSTENTSKDEYNDIPVFYCKRCLSTRVMSVGLDLDYCDDCGSGNIETTHINELLKLRKESNYKDKYGSRK